MNKPTQSFFNELQVLIDAYPKPTVHIDFSQDTSQGDYVFYCKNCNSCFDCVSCENCRYLYDAYMCTDCIDCDYATECQICYECVDITKCFNCSYVENSLSLTNAAFCYGCSNCTDIFGCVKLRNKSYCLFNRQLSKEEYYQELKKYQQLSAKKILDYLNKLKLSFPYTQTNEGNNVNTTYGNYIYYNRDCYLCFDAAYNQHCAYLDDSFENNNCLDLTHSAYNELSSNCVDSVRMFNCAFSYYSSDCRDSNLLIGCMNLENCFGCVNLLHKKFCILNRQFSPEDYFKLRSQINSGINQWEVWENLRLIESSLPT